MSETRALELLRGVRDEFRRRISDEFKFRAKPCSMCETPGACCLDAHFVNVRISRLESTAIMRVLDELDEPHRIRVYARIDDAIRRFRLDGGDGSPTYACPLHETGIGCLVHDTAKPLPCIHHACYENREDLPPNELLAAAELEVAQLNGSAYGRQQTFLPLPVAIKNIDAI